MKITELFNKPKIIVIVGNVGEAKSNTAYFFLEELNKIGTYNLYTYGLRNEIKGAVKIYSTGEMEQIRNSVIMIDEVMTLWDIDNKMAKRQIENTLRLIEHNNNILILCAVPENLKKFICGKVNTYIYKKVTFADFINGCSAKRTILEYGGYERGSNVLDLSKNEAIIFDGKHYTKINVPYLAEYDSKANNEKIIKVNEMVNEKVNEENPSPDEIEAYIQFDTKEEIK
jgi:CBS domain-containing protein